MVTYNHYTSVRDFSKNEEVTRRAKSIVGLPFRLGGRSVISGFDCIGVVLYAYAIEQEIFQKLPNYSLCSGNEKIIKQWLKRLKFYPVNGHELSKGCLIVTHPHSMQWHLIVHAGVSLVEAHAGLRKIVETPVKALDSQRIFGVYQR